MAATERGLRRREAPGPPGLPPSVPSASRGRRWGTRSARGKRAVADRYAAALLQGVRRPDAGHQPVRQRPPGPRRRVGDARPPPRLRHDLGRVADGRLSVRRRDDVRFWPYVRRAAASPAGARTTTSASRSASPGAGSSARTCPRSTCRTRKRTTTRPGASACPTRGRSRAGAARCTPACPSRATSSLPSRTTSSCRRKSKGYALGWTWILDERDLFDVSASLMKLSGYLDDPYKIVPVGTPDNFVEMPDHRPDSRQRRAVVGKYGHYYLWGGALKATYRYYWDDWSVKAHTLELVVRPSPERGLARLADGAPLHADGRVVLGELVRHEAGVHVGGLPPRGVLEHPRRPHGHAQDERGVRREPRLHAPVAGRQGLDHGLERPRRGRARAGSATVSAADLSVTTISAGFTWRY